MMLTITGLVLLSTIILRMNSSTHTTSVDLNSNKLNIMAVSLVTSYLEEMKLKAFDENTVDKSIGNETYLTSSAGLGKESSESRTNYKSMNATNFDDVDDYNNDSVEVQLESVSGFEPAIFKLKCKVAYFDPSTANTTTSKKFHKKITVTITSNSLTDPMSLSTVFSYWKFR